MKAIDIYQYFQAVRGSQPWSVKLGVGSFLTFDFGSRIRKQGHLYGQWRLWVYLSNWTLFHGDRQLVNSDTDRKLIKVSVRRLEDSPLTKIDFDARSRKTTFSFNDFRLVVSPADYLKEADERDNYWMFFMPNDEVLAVGPSGTRVISANALQRV